MIDPVLDPCIGLLPRGLPMARLVMIGDAQDHIATLWGFNGTAARRLAYVGRQPSVQAATPQRPKHHETTNDRDHNQCDGENQQVGRYGSDQSGRRHQQPYPRGEEGVSTGFRFVAHTSIPSALQTPAR